MQIQITVDMTGESIERQLEIVRQASRMAEEIIKEYGAHEENAPEKVEVTPKALEEQLKMQERQKERDRQRLAMSREYPGIGV